LQRQSPYIFCPDAHLGPEDAAVLDCYIIAHNHYSRVGVIQAGIGGSGRILHIIIELGSGILCHPPDGKAGYRHSIAKHLDSRLLHSGGDSGTVLPLYGQGPVHNKAIDLSCSNQNHIARLGGVYGALHISAGLDHIGGSGQAGPEE